MDYKELYADLTEKIQNQLPLKAFPIRELVQILRDKNTPVTLHTEMTITSVFNSGDISGIMCAIEAKEVEGLACSLSHLNFKNECPLYKEITNYQIKRAKRVDKLIRMG